MASALSFLAGPLRHARHTLVDRLVGALLSRAAGLSPSRCLALGRALGVLGYVLAGPLRRRAHGNLRRVFPAWGYGARVRVLLGLARRLGECAAQSLLVARGSLTVDALVAVPSESRAALRPSPRGVVLATGHLGNWELLGAALAALGHETLAVVRPSRNERLARRVTALREALGFRELPRAATVGVACVRALRRGALVGLLGDQASDPRSAMVSFLGSPSPTPLGPALLSRRTGARLVAAWLERRPDGGWTLRATEVPASARDEDTLLAINDLMSDAIRADPSGWVWFHDRWRLGAPRGGARGHRWGLAAALAGALLLWGAAPPGARRCTDQGCVTVLREVRVGPGPRHRVDVYLPWPPPAAARGAVVLIHGGGWNDPAQRKDGLEDEALRFATALRLPALSVEYRLAREGGRYPEAVRDVRCALAWLGAHATEYGLRRDRVVLYGGSAGAQLALLSSDRGAPSQEAPPPACGPAESSVWASAVVAVSAPTDLGHLWQHPLSASAAELRRAVEDHVGHGCDPASGDAWEGCLRASPISRAERLPPYLLVHSDGDHLVPMHQPEHLLAEDARTRSPRGRLLFVPASERARCPEQRSMHGGSPCLLRPAWEELQLFTWTYTR